MNLKLDPEKQGVSQRHIPQRSCVACRKASNKRILIRLVADSGIIEIDTKGKKAGRGAYLCPIRECWEAALKSNRLEFALRARFSPENRRTLLTYSESLPKKGEANL